MRFDMPHNDKHTHRDLQTPSEFRAFHSSDVKALESDLRKAITGEVRFDAGSRAMYSTDASNYRQVPIGVVLPKSKDDIEATVRVARQYGAPILARGGGTSLAGQCCNVAVVLDMSKYMNRIIDIDPAARTARVEPGLVLDRLRSATERHHLTFAPDPATHNHCTLGGMIGNNSCGVHSLMGGRTLENIEELEILTYDGLRITVGATSDVELEHIIRRGGRQGEIYAHLKELRNKYGGLVRSRFPKIPRRVSGYSIDQLLPENGFHVARSLVGSESTCVMVLEAKVKLVPSPQFRTLVVAGYEDIFTAADEIPYILEHQPIALEGLDELLVDAMRKKHLHPQNLTLLPEGRAWLMIEFGGASREEADGRANSLIDGVRSRNIVPSTKLFDDPREERIVWRIRESALGATARVPGEPDTWEGWEDSAVSPEKTGDYLRQLRKLLDHHGYRGALYGHLGQGCVHTRINFDLQTREGIHKFRRFVEEAADLVVSFGGSLSGEHGDGQSRAELLPKMFGDQLVKAFREFKTIWDVEWKMNPGKLVDPYRLDENLRFGTSYEPSQPATSFDYSEDKNSFAYAMTRCVGVGECRKTDHGTMCPSYMVTNEEMHSTRGRARLLFEMLQDGPLKSGWQNEHVRDALDLCFACKACKSECPVNVDMATYKAEFLSHYYEGHRRPVSAYTMGWIHRWARLAGYAPRLANVFTQTPALAAIGKRIAGIAPERQLPMFASKPFTRSSFVKKGPLENSGSRVILWPDTFNNYFHPEVCVSAATVLRDAGFQVELPRKNLCCGRPLYDFGFVSEAKALLAGILDTLRTEIRSGVPIVILEPSCAAVFRDELLNLFPNDPDALRLSRQALLLSEFLENHVKDYEPPKLSGKAVVHGHCHHKAVLKMDAEERLLSRLGFDLEVLDAGCCGMAGAFGFEEDHYDVSVRAAERVLLPRLHELSEDAVIIADGFSCREQIRQLTGLKTYHIAEVLADHPVGVLNHL
jgi:FAD/FMN-containing dehydrogenase/Fe-S oxidoreductase